MEPTEVREVLSEGEERFERIRKTTGLFLGPVVFLAVFLYPLGLGPAQHRLASVLAFVLVYWLTEAIPIPATALVGAVLNILLGVAPAGEVFAPFAHPLVFLFIGSFILSEAIRNHGLDRRFAYAIFSIRFLERSPLRVLFALGLIVAIASMWVSNTASTAMMLPIALGVLGAAREVHSRTGSDFDFKGFATATMLMVAYGASVGGIATPIGTPPNLIGLGMIDTLVRFRITFLEWMAFALPITAVMFVYLFVILGLGRGWGRARLEGVGDFARSARRELGHLSRAEKNTAFCFAVAVTLWVLPSVVALFIGKNAPPAVLLSSRLNSGAVAMAAAGLLFILPVDLRRGEFTMDWRRAAKIDWGTVLLFGGGLSLGSLMFSTGLADTLGETLTSATGASTLWGVTAVGTALAIILSETTSNTASANMIIPVMIAIAQGMGVSPLPPALGATLGASFGFMLPVSTPPNAIVYGIGGFLIIMAGLMVLCPLFGWV